MTGKELTKLRSGLGIGRNACLQAVERGGVYIERSSRDKRKLYVRMLLDAAQRACPNAPA